MGTRYKREVHNRYVRLIATARDSQDIVDRRLEHLPGMCVDCDALRAAKLVVKGIAYDDLKKAGHKVELVPLDRIRFWRPDLYGKKD